MIEMRQVSKVYSTRVGGALTALSQVDLTIDDGEFVTVVGPSGCGKTTLLNLIAGFERPTEGTLMANGARVEQPGPDRAVVFQQPSLLPWMTVKDNIAFGLMIRDGKARMDQGRIQTMIETMGLHGFERHYPYQLSGGMQQRVAIGRALITEPQVLLMDEPFGALDAQTRSEMQRFLLALWQRLSPTILFVTHDVEEAILLADRVVVMTTRPGSIAQIIEVHLPQPRHWDLVLGREFNDYKRHVLQVLRSKDAS